MHSLPSSDRAAEAERVAGLVRLIRRVCLLREQGEAAAAIGLQTGELAAAVTAFRAEYGAASLPDEKLAALFLSETEHVTEAMVLAELLVPQLARLMPAAGAARAPLFPPTPAVAAPVRSAPGGSPVITDLLDAMLAAERTGRRPSPAPPRES